MTNKSIDNFNFSFKMANDTKKDIQSQYDNLEERIDKIINSDNFLVSGIPILKSIMALEPDSDELRKVAKAIERLADLNEVFQELSGKLSLINTIMKDPNWFTWSFGDFASDVDKAISDMFKDTDS